MRKSTSAILSLLILLAGAGVMVMLIHSKPRAATRPQKSGAVLVDAIRVNPMDRPVEVGAMGVVMAAHTVMVQPQVSGRVVWLSPNIVPGGRLKKGDKFVRIDDRDYKAVVVQRKAAVQKAKYDLIAEQARGSVAKREWSMMKGKVKTAGADKALVLRKPQLAMAQAAMQSAKSGLRIAMINLSRTTIRTPFDAIVMKKNVDAGQVVGPGAAIATLVDTGDFWVQTAIPVDELAWFDLPGVDAKGGAAARVVQQLADGRQSIRKGRVIRVLGDLEPKGRMARVLIDVADPLATGNGLPKLPLLIGNYVHVKIKGHTLKQVFVLPRRALRDDNRVYVITGDNKLSVRKVRILRREKGNALVRGDLRAGDMVITSRLDTAVNGMVLRLFKKHRQDNKKPVKNGRK